MLMDPISFANRALQEMAEGLVCSSGILTHQGKWEVGRNGTEGGMGSKFGQQQYSFREKWLKFQGDICINCISLHSRV